MNWVLGLFVVSLMFACFGGYVSVQKNREIWEGIIFGALFGPFGLIVAGLLPDDGKTPDARQYEQWQREQDERPTPVIRRP